MRLRVVVVGSPGKLLRPAIEEYERRARRYWSLDVDEVREEKAARSRTPAQIRSAESERLFERVPAGFEPLVLTRGGEAWSSTQLARFLDDLATRAAPGAAFIIGGALGVDLDGAPPKARRLSLAPVTLPHDLARLVLTEQLYRAGTILRNEPYHKAAE